MASEQAGAWMSGVPPALSSVGVGHLRAMTRSHTFTTGCEDVAMTERYKAIVLCAAILFCLTGCSRPPDTDQERNQIQ